MTEQELKGYGLRIVGHFVRRQDESKDHGFVIEDNSNTVFSPNGVLWSGVRGEFRQSLNSVCDLFQTRDEAIQAATELVAKRKRAAE